MNKPPRVHSFMPKWAIAANPPVNRGEVSVDELGLLRIDATSPARRDLSPLCLEDRHVDVLEGLLVPPPSRELSPVEQSALKVRRLRSIVDLAKDPLLSEALSLQPKAVCKKGEDFTNQSGFGQPRKKTLPSLEKSS